MSKALKYITSLWTIPSVRNKIIYTIVFLALYRLFVFIPVPFVDVDILMNQTIDTTS